MALTDKRTVEAVAGFEGEQIIAQTVGNHTELLGRFGKLRLVNAKQFELSLVHGGDVDDE